MKYLFLELNNIHVKCFWSTKKIEIIMILKSKFEKENRKKEVKSCW